MPSEILNIKDDDYTAYCLNEACAFIILKMQNKEEPQFEKEYHTFSQLYDSLDIGNKAERR